MRLQLSLRSFSLEGITYAIPLFLFSLWDYYIISYGGRICDYFGILLILFFASYKMFKINIANYYINQTVSLILLFTLPLFCVQIISGLLQDGILTSAAFCVGLFLIFPYFLHFDYDFRYLLKIVNILIVVNLIFFYIQFLAFKCFGTLIDYHSCFDVISLRIFNPETLYFRAAGLFQEPNSFCLTIYMLTVIRLFLKRGAFDLLLIITLAAIFLSESLWGFGAVFSLLILFTPSKLYRLSIIGLFVLFGIILVYTPKYAMYLLDPITVGRISNITDDGSYHGRYGQESNVNYDVNFFFGNGLTTKKFQGFTGANAIGFILYSFGLFGFIFFLVVLAIAFKKNRIALLFAVIFAMTSYPLFTYMFWWAWLGILIRLSRSINFSTAGPVPLWISSDCIEPTQIPSPSALT